MASTSPEPSKRSLPKRLNPLLAPDETPPLEELVARRRLGQTDLKVKPSQVGTSNATKVSNLGQFDYAHLRAPLPKNLKGSEIFAPQKHTSNPEAYFLMRRSSDGFISATGMFKLAFPWAQHAEEQAERDYIKGLPSSSQDEVAGNVWISESFALELAEDYSIVPWIVALLDSSVVKGADSKDTQRVITSPPNFSFTMKDKAHLPPPKEAARASTPSRGRGRPRASTPSKSATPSIKNGSPRKQRATKASKEANAASAREANASLQDDLDKSAEAADSRPVNGEESADDKKAVLKVVSETVVNGTEETTDTKLEFQFPGGTANVPVPENPEKMIAEAQEMVEQALRIEGESSRAPKRKAEEMEEDTDEEGEGEQPAKRAKLLQQKLKTERVRNRALIGLTATLIIGAAIPYFV